MTEPKSTIGSHISWPVLTAGIWGVIFVINIATMLGIVGFLTPHKDGVKPATGPVRRTGSVYPDFTSAAEHWMTRQPLYVRGGINEYRYSPVVAACFVPLDLLPDKLGEFFWRSLNFAIFLCSLWLCCRWWVPHRLSANQSAAVFLLVIPLAVGSLNNAQSNPLVLGLMLLATAATTRRWFTVAAVAITVATCFKVYPIALGMLLMLRFPWRLGWRLAVSLATAAVLPFVLQKASYVLDQYQSWIGYLVSEDRQSGPIADWYRDLRAVSRIYVRPMPLRTYEIVEVAAGAVIAGVCLIALARHWTLRSWAGTALGLACCWMTAVGPATESPTYILVAPALAWGIVWADPRGRAWRLLYGVVFGLFLFSQLAINIHLGTFFDGKYFRDHLQPLPIAGLLLLLLQLVDAVIRLLPPAGRPRPGDGVPGV